MAPQISVFDADVDVNVDKEEGAEELDILLAAILQLSGIVIVRGEEGCGVGGGGRL